MSILEIIIYSIIGFSVVAYLIYSVFFKKKKQPKQKTDNNNTTERD